MFNENVVLSSHAVHSFAISSNAGKIQKDGRKESCKPILKVEYKTSRNRCVFSSANVQIQIPGFHYVLNSPQFTFHDDLNAIRGKFISVISSCGKLTRRLLMKPRLVAKTLFYDFSSLNCAHGVGWVKSHFGCNRLYFSFILFGQAFILSGLEIDC